jgi:hypothetical protein
MNTQLRPDGTCVGRYPWTPACAGVVGYGDSQTPQQTSSERWSLRQKGKPKPGHGALYSSPLTYHSIPVTFERNKE